MKNFLSVLIICALAVSVNFSAMATPMVPRNSGNDEVHDDATPSSSGGDVFAETIKALKDLDKLKDDGAAEAVGNTLGEATAAGIIETQYEQCKAEHGESYCKALKKEALKKAGLDDEANEIKMTPEEIRREKEKEAAKEYAECLKSNTQETCQKRLDDAYDEAKAEHFRADPEQAQKELSEEHEKCLSETTGGSASDISAYCKMKYKESLNDVGLKEDANAVTMSPEEERAAKEVQAEQDYDECIKRTKSEATCSQQLDKAYDEAKKDYYKENPELAKKEVTNEYEKCTAQNPGTRGEAYCKSEAKKTLDDAGIPDDSIQMHPEETRMAKEVQAEKDYYACVNKGNSDATCQKNYTDATRDAKLEYYRAEPDKAREEIEADYSRCRSQVGGNSAQGIADCNQSRSSMLQQAGLEDTAPKAIPSDISNINIYKDDPNDVSNKYNSDSTGREETPHGNEPDWDDQQDDEDDPESNQR